MDIIGHRINTPKSSAVDLIVFPQDLYVEALNLNVTVFGSEALERY